MVSTNSISSDITMNGSLKYIGVTLSNDGSFITEIYTRIASATTAITTFGMIWRSTSKCFTTKYNLFRLLALSIFLNRCESRTLSDDAEKKIKEL